MAIEIMEKITLVLRNKTKPFTIYELIKEINQLGKQYTHQQIRYVLGRMVKEQKIEWDKEKDLISLI